MPIPAALRHTGRPQFDEHSLIWNETKVRSTPNLYRHLADRGVDTRHLPEVITLSVDSEVADDAVDVFLDGFCAYLPGEFHRRERRRARFVELGYFDETELDQFLIGHRGVQPWLIYYSKDGGLGTYNTAAYSGCAAEGLIPCFAMRNHGVAWQKSQDGTYSTTLVTSRKPGANWDWDSDIGHESAHAAFSPVPLFTLPADELTDANRLSTVREVDELTPKHLASICYLCCEVAVVALRGESRDTKSGLPSTERSEDLPLFFRLADDLMPGLGFDRALAAFERAGRVVDCNEGEEIFELGAPAIRAMSRIYPEFRKFVVPSLSWFRSLAVKYA